MPLFAYQDGRALPVSAPRPEAGAWSDEATAEIRRCVLDLVETPLLPLAWRPDDAVLGEYLVALDATGAAVVVVVREAIDSETFVAALARSAVVRRSAWRDVAVWYPAGPEQLRGDWAVFRESLPPRGEAAPGLVLLAGRFTPEVRSAVELLDGGTVAVHEVGAREQDGRHLIAIEPVTARVVTRHVVLEIGASGRLDGVVDGMADGVPDAALVGGIAAAPGVPVFEGVEPAEVSEALESLEASEVPEPAEAPEAPEASEVPEPAEITEPPAPAEPLRRRRARHERPPVAEGPEGLAAVVALVGESELVLDGSGGAVRALLTQDAALAVGGARYDDPTAAAVAVTGRPVPDGWVAWRFGEDGPYLGEAVEEALAPARPANRPRRRRAVRR